MCVRRGIDQMKPEARRRALELWADLQRPAVYGSDKFAEVLAEYRAIFQSEDSYKEEPLL